MPNQSRTQPADVATNTWPWHEDAATPAALAASALIFQSLMLEPWIGLISAGMD
jgi:hypothetical protein